MSVPLPLFLALLSLFAGLFAFLLARSGKRKPLMYQSPGRQLAVVQQARFSTKPVWSPEQADMYALLAAVADVAEGTYSVLSQVWLKSVITADPGQANRSQVELALRTKYIDFLVVDADARPVAAVQMARGQRGDADQTRAEIAQEALTKAGLALIMVGKSDADKDVAARLLALLDGQDGDAGPNLRVVPSGSSRPGGLAQLNAPRHRAP